MKPLRKYICRLIECILDVLRLNKLADKWYLYARYNKSWY